MDTTPDSDPAPPELPFLLHRPEALREGSPLLVLLHGRGSDERDLQGFASLLPEDVLLVTPRAPFPAAAWGYGPGWAWYRYRSADQVVDETLSASLEALDRFLAGLGERLPVRPGPLVLGGFSQGGTTSLAFALSRPGRVAGVANLSGFLVDSQLVPVTSESAGKLAVFWGHGRGDAAIPFELGTRGRTRLGELGAKLELFDHPGGHTITPEEFASFRVWLEGRRAR